MKKMGLGLLAMVLILGFAGSAMATQGDKVFSNDIKEADGISGQGTNTGSGIKTGHIQDGAVTNAKIAGPIGVEKLSVYKGIRIVHKGLANGTNTFSRITDALNAITDASATSRYAVVVMPGVYEENITGKSYVDILGQSRTGSIISAGNATVTMAPDSNLKNLTIETNDGIAVLLSGANSGIYDCDIAANLNGAWVLPYGVSVTSEKTTIQNITVKGFNYIGLDFWDISGDASTVTASEITMHGTPHTAVSVQFPNNPTATVKISKLDVRGSSKGLYLGCGNVEIDSAVIEARYLSITSNCGPGSVKIGNSKIKGAIYSNGNLKIVHSYDGNYDPIADGVY